MKRLLLLFVTVCTLFSLPHTLAFSDVDDTTGSSEAIYTLSQLGVVSGYDDNTFRPLTTINRAEFLKMVLSSQEIAPNSQNYSNCFQDVTTQWFAPYVCYAKSKNWISGINSTHFAPERTITRAEALKIVLNVYGYDIPVTMGTYSAFTDVAPDSWYAGFVHVAQRRNITDLQGMHFFPNNMITRASASEILYRSLMVKYTQWPVFDRDMALTFLAEELQIYPSTDDYTEQEWDMSLYFKIWNDLRYYHPDSDSVSDEDMYYASIKGLADSLKDPYTYFLSPDETEAFLDELDGTFVGIGIAYEESEKGIRVIRIFENSPAGTSSMEVGDIITEIDGKSMAGIRAEQFSSFMTGEEGTSVSLTLEKKTGLKETINVIRSKVTIPSVEYTAVDSATARILINQFAEDTGAAVQKALERMEQEGKTKLIVDLRNNGGGYMESAIEIGSFFLPTGRTLFFNEEYPYPKKTKFTSLPGYKLPENVKVAVLVNESTASAAEIVTASLQDNKRATVIGNYTFGKGVAQQLFPYADNSILRITTSKWYTPNEKNVGTVQDGHKGITPDIVVDQTVDMDNVMQKAIEILR